MFSVHQLIDDCKRAVARGDGHKAVQALVERAVSEPSSVLAALGEPAQAGVQKLYVADDLTVLHVIWGPQMVLMPHNHQMWAVIGVYTGREDNIFWRRIPEEENGRLKAAGARSLAAKDVEALGPDVIHSVTNPVNRLTGAIHIYGHDVDHLFLFDFGKPGPQGQSKIPPSGVRGDRLCLRSTLFFGFSPPWCEMTVFYCSLYKILTMSYRPDSYKVRSGPGVSGVRCQKNVPIMGVKNFPDLDSYSSPAAPKASG